MRRIFIAFALILALLGAFTFKVLAGGAQSGLGNAGALLGTYSGLNKPNGVAWSGTPAPMHFDNNDYPLHYDGPGGMPGGFGSYSFGGGGGSSTTTTHTVTITSNSTPAASNAPVLFLDVSFVKDGDGSGNGGNGNGSGKVQAPEPVSSLLFLFGAAGLFTRKLRKTA